MAEGDVSAGRLVADVVGDTSGTARDVQRKLDVEMAKVRAKIKAQIDTRSLVADAKKAAAEASKSATITLKATVDRASLQRDLTKAVRDVRASVGVKLTIDRAAFQRDLNATIKSVRTTATVQVNADTTTARQQIQQAAKDTVAEIRVEADTRAAEARLQETTDRERTAEIKADADTVDADAKLAGAAKARLAIIKAVADIAAAQAAYEKVAADRHSNLVVDADTFAATAAFTAAARDRVSNIKADTDVTAADVELAKVARDRAVEIKADADTAAAEVKLDLAARDREVKFNVNVDSNLIQRTIGGLASSLSSVGGGGSGNIGGVFSAITSGAQSAGLAMAGAAASGAPLIALYGGLAAAAGAAGSALFAMASAGAQAGGVLAALPNLIGAAAQGIGALYLGLSGIGAAVTAIGKANDGASAAATAQAQAQANAAASVKAAQQSVADTARNITETEKAGAYAITQAEVQVSAARKAAAQTATQGAQAVVAAKRQETQAENQAAQAQRAAESNLQTAQYNSAQAAKSVQDAQDALNQAREDAVQNLKDLALEEGRANLDRRGAILGIAEAKKNLDAVNSDPTSTDLQRREAKLQYDEAIQSLKEIENRNKQLREDKREADKEGVKGADNVKSAEDQVAAALRAQQQAAEALRAAQRGVTQAQVQGARAVAAAQRNVTRTIRETAAANVAAVAAVAAAQHNLGSTRTNVKDSNRSAVEQHAAAERSLTQALQSQTTAATATTSAQQALAAAMSGLSPAGQRFARFIANTIVPGFTDLKKAVQESLLPPLEQGIKAAGPLFGVLQKGIVGSADVIGRVGERLGKILGSGPFDRKVGAIMEGNNKALGHFGKALGNIIEAGATLGQAAIPLLTRFSKYVERVSKNVRNFLNQKSRDGGLQTFLQRAGDAAANLWHGIGLVIKIIGGLARAALPAGKALNGSFSDALQAFSDFVNSDEGQAKIRKFFQDIVPEAKALGGTVVDITKAFFKFVQDVAPAIAKIAKGIGWIAGKFVDLMNSGFFEWWAELFHNIGVEGTKWVKVITKILGAIFTVFKWLYNVLVGHSIVPDMVKAIIATFHWLGDLIGWFRDLFKKIASVFTDAYKFIVDKTKDFWNAVSDKVSDSMTWIHDKIKSIFDGIETVFTNVFDVVGTKWGNFWDGLKTKSDTVFGKIKDGIKNTLDGIKTAFDNTKDAIGKVFDGVANVVRAPINFVITTVYTNGIKALIDKVVDAVGLDSLELPDVARIPKFGAATGAILPGFTPGRDVHQFYSPTAGRLDLSGGESVMRPEYTQAVGADHVNGANAAARSGGVMGVRKFLGGFARGGVVGDPGADPRKKSADKPASPDTADQVTAVAGWPQVWAWVKEHLGLQYIYGGNDPNVGLDCSSWTQHALAAAGYVLPRTAATQQAAASPESSGQLIPGDLGFVGTPAHHVGLYIGNGKWASEHHTGTVSSINSGDGWDNYGRIVGNTQQVAAGEATGGGVGGFITSLVDVLPDFYSDVKAVKDNISSMAGKFGDSPFVQAAAKIPSELLGKVVDWAKSKVTSVLPTDAGFSPGAAGVWDALSFYVPGYSTAQIAGIMGNMQVESGFQPNIVQGGGTSMDPSSTSGGYGLVQWTPGSKLSGYLNGKPPTVASEVGALMEQLSGRGPSPEGAAGDAVRAAKTPSEAASAFMHNYERPANYSTEGSRQAAAEGFYKNPPGHGITSQGPHVKDKGGWLKDKHTAMNLSGHQEAVLDPQQSLAFVALVDSVVQLVRGKRGGDPTGGRTHRHRHGHGHGHDGGDDPTATHPTLTALRHGFQLLDADLNKIMVLLQRAVHWLGDIVHNNGGVHRRRGMPDGNNIDRGRRPPWWRRAHDLPPRHPGGGGGDDQRWGRVTQRANPVHSVFAAGVHHSLAEQALERGGTVFQDGSIRVVVHNPVGKTTEQSVSERMRSLSQFGVFGG